MLMATIVAVSAGVQASLSSGGARKSASLPSVSSCEISRKPTMIVAEMRAHGGAKVAGGVDEQREQGGECADRDGDADVHAEHGCRDSSAGP